MQRWMQAKMMLAAKHGVTVSMAGQIGTVREDRPIGYVEPKILPAPKIGTVHEVCRKAKRPKAWGSKKAARRAARPMPDEKIFNAQSRIKL